MGLKLQKHQTLKILDIFILLLLINKIQNTIVNTNIWITETLFRGRILGVGREGFSTICISSPVFFFFSVMLRGGWWSSFSNVVRRLVGWGSSNVVLQKIFSKQAHCASAAYTNLKRTGVNNCLCLKVVVTPLKN